MMITDFQGNREHQFLHFFFKLFCDVRTKEPDIFAYASISIASCYQLNLKIITRTTAQINLRITWWQYWVTWHIYIRNFSHDGRSTWYWFHFKILKAPAWIRIIWNNEISIFLKYIHINLTYKETIWSNKYMHMLHFGQLKNVAMHIATIYFN